MKKTDFDVSTNDLLFEEEVVEEELHSKKNVSDIIYEDADIRRRRKNFLIVVAIILMIVSVLSAFLGFLCLDKEIREKSSNTVVTKYDLFVAHSNHSYGGVISSFSGHRTSDTAYLYKFSVSNNNPVELKYFVEFVNPDFGSNSIDMSSISYELLKNDEVVAKGSLINNNSTRIYDANIKKNSVDKYVFKIWSSSIDKNLNLNFKLNVDV